VEQPALRDGSQVSYKNYNLKETTPVKQVNEPGLRIVYRVRSYEKRPQSLTLPFVVLSALGIAFTLFVFFVAIPEWFQ
jgi:hypothetical protein